MPAATTVRVTLVLRVVVLFTGWVVIEAAALTVTTVGAEAVWQPLALVTWTL